MHIFEMLMRDHEKIKELLAELVSLDDNDKDSRDDLIQDIRDELVPHSRAEESVFYNSLRVLETDRDEVMHSFREHMEAEALLRLLQVEEKMNIGWKTTAQKLKKAVEHHIHEEETKFFAAARKVLTSEEAQTLGTLFEKLKPQIQDEGFMKTSFEMLVNAMPVRFVSALKKISSGYH